jgi:hypothetical protein
MYPSELGSELRSPQARFVVITENYEILRFFRNYEKNHYEQAKSLCKVFSLGVQEIDPQAAC